MYGNICFQYRFKKVSGSILEGVGPQMRIKMDQICQIRNDDSSEEAFLKAFMLLNCVFVLILELSGSISEGLGRFWERSGTVLDKFWNLRGLTFGLSFFCVSL